MSNTQSPLVKKNYGAKAGRFALDNIVTLFFILLCLGAFAASGKGLPYLFSELFTRISRNAFLVMSLLIPVVAGLGLNFGIVIGAIATQISIFWVVYWGFSGMTGILMCVLICTPLAILFGWGVGKLFNSMKGSEMIGGLMLGYFAEGLYLLFFLYIIGGIIPVQNDTLIIAGGIGVKNTIDMTGNLKYAIDNLPMLTILQFALYIIAAITVVRVILLLVRKNENMGKELLKALVPLAIVGAAYGVSFVPMVNDFLSTDRLQLLNALEIACLIAVAWCVVRIVLHFVKKKKGLPVREFIGIGAAVVLYLLTYLDVVYQALIVVHLPVFTYVLIIGLCLFTRWFLNTKLGQDMRTVGQNRDVATSAGINVNRTRVIAMIMSTVLASYGQLIFLQNLGTFSTYGAHTQVGQYAIAALLVGGASVKKATIKQALLGVVLFHALFILSPLAGQQLLGNAQIGEYFRVFVAYGVIALALALHAWQSRSKAAGKKKAKAKAAKANGAG